MAVNHWLPCIIMIFSYAVIGYYIHSNGEYFKQVGSHEVKKMLFKRELQFAKTFFMIVLIYFVSVQPLTLLNIIDAQILAEHFTLSRVLLFFYYSQFSLNFFVYGAKSEQYRNAYFFFLQKVIKYL